MDIQGIKYQLKADNKLSTSVVNLDENCTSSVIIDTINLYFEKSNEELRISIKNNGSSSIILNKLELELYSARNYKNNRIIINPKTICEKISCIHLERVNEREKIQSYLFETLLDNENGNRKFFGFLGSKRSRNNIENVFNRNEFNIKAVYNFIKYELKPKEELKLDSLYCIEGQDIFTLFNSYMDVMSADSNFYNNSYKKAELEKSNVYSILFTYKVNDNTLKIENKPVYLKVNKKKLYAVDISTEEGKNKVFSNANAVINKAAALDINGIGMYISIIEEHKLFNVHYELNKLLTLIKDRFEETGFFSDDYALGLFDAKVTVGNKTFDFEEHKGLFNQLAKKKSNNFNYDFFFKLLLQRFITYKSQSFFSNNKKINELMSVILAGAGVNSLDNKELMAMALDIGNKYVVIPYAERSKVFALLVTGLENMYIAVFNFGNKPVKFYCDLSNEAYFHEADGVATEIYSDNSYLISDGKLYIRSVPSIDCCLFKKVLSKTA